MPADVETGRADAEPRARETVHRTAHIGAAVSVLDDRAFLILVIATSIAFAFVLWPFFGAIFWATVLAILFAPLHRWLTPRMGQRRTPAALATVAIILLMVILPAAAIAASLVRESLGVYERMQSGELDFARMFDQVWAVLPSWVTRALQAIGLTELGDLQARLFEGLTKGLQLFATRAYSIGQNAFAFVV